LHGTVEYLIVMQEDAKATLATEGNDRMEDVSNRTAQEVLDDHLNLAEYWWAEDGGAQPISEEAMEQAVEEDIRRNVSEDIVILINRGTFRGYEGVRQLARMLIEELPEHRSFEYTYKAVEGRMGFLEWTYEDDNVRVKDGADSYLIEDGKIVAQTIHYTVEQK
jgi:SnoaL-like domain